MMKRAMMKRAMLMRAMMMRATREQAINRPHLIQERVGTPRWKTITRQLIESFIKICSRRLSAVRHQLCQTRRQTSLIGARQPLPTLTLLLLSQGQVEIVLATYRRLRMLFHWQPRRNRKCSRHSVGTQYPLAPTLQPTIVLIISFFRQAHAT
jgi:hypothetical protein